MREPEKHGERTPANADFLQVPSARPSSAGIVCNRSTMAVSIAGATRISFKPTSPKMKMKFHFVCRRPWQATQDLSGAQDNWPQAYKTCLQLVGDNARFD
jgi:hypothetical protein